MPFLNASISCQVYTDPDQTEFPQELLPSIQKEFSSSDITEIQSTTVTLTASGSQVIAFNGVDTVKRWYMYSNSADVGLEINGGASVTFQAGEPGYVPITLTSLHITNLSASVATTVTLVMIAS